MEEDSDSEGEGEGREEEGEVVVLVLVVIAEEVERALVVPGRVVVDVDVDDVGIWWSSES